MTRGGYSGISSYFQSADDGGGQGGRLHPCPLLQLHPPCRALSCLHPAMPGFILSTPRSHGLQGTGPCEWRERANLPMGSAGLEGGGCLRL